MLTPEVLVARKAKVNWVGAGRRSGPCILDSRDSFLGGGKEGESCVMRMPHERARQRRAGEVKQEGDRRSLARSLARSLRHNGRMRYAATATHSSSLPASRPPLLPSSLSPLSPFPLLCHHVPRKSINTGTTRGPRCQGGGQKRTETSLAQPQLG